MEYKAELERDGNIEVTCGDKETLDIVIEALKSVGAQWKSGSVVYYHRPHRLDYVNVVEEIK